MVYSEDLVPVCKVGWPQTIPDPSVRRPHQRSHRETGDRARWGQQLDLHCNRYTKHQKTKSLSYAQTYCFSNESIRDQCFQEGFTQTGSLMILFRSSCPSWTVLSSFLPCSAPGEHDTLWHKTRDVLLVLLCHHTKPRFSLITEFAYKVAPLDLDPR